jgi:hypothetical protein
LSRANPTLPTSSERSEPPRELRRHPAQVRYTLLAALCWQREQEITDSLVELLKHIAHRVGVRAETRVELELMKYSTRVLGKARLLYQLAKAAKARPDDLVRDVIYPAVGEKTLEDIICEAEAADNYEHRVTALLLERSAWKLFKKILRPRGLSAEIVWRFDLLQVLAQERKAILWHLRGGG